MNSVATKDALIASAEAAEKSRSGIAHTLGKIKFDGDREPIYGINGQLANRNVAYPCKGNGIAASSFMDHAEGDMVHTAATRGYSGGNAVRTLWAAMPAI